MGRGLFKRGRIWWICYAGPDGRLIRESSRSYKCRDAEKLLIQRRQMVREGIKPDAKRLGNDTFRALIGRWAELNPRERQAVIFTLYGGRCHYCGCEVHIPLVREKKSSPDRCVLDHKRPFAHGGADTFDNIVLSCEECNQKKSEKSYEDFMSQQAPWLKKSGNADA